MNPTSIYRYYDADGRLIYVGITSRGMLRQNEHNAHAPWWRFVASQDVEHVDTREAALRRERALIERHRPPFNRQHNPDGERRRAEYLARCAPNFHGSGDDDAVAIAAAFDEGVEHAWALADKRYAPAYYADHLLHLVIDEGGLRGLMPSIGSPEVEESINVLHAAIAERGLTAVVDEAASARNALVARVVEEVLA